MPWRSLGSGSLFLSWLPKSAMRNSLCRKPSDRKGVSRGDAQDGCPVRSSVVVWTCPKASGNKIKRYMKCSVKKGSESVVHRGV